MKRRGSKNLVVTERTERMRAEGASEAKVSVCIVEK